MKCSSCGGALPPKSDICPYCQSYNEIDFSGFDYAVVATRVSSGSCPRCNSSLQRIQLHLGAAHQIERCESCFGVYLVPGLLETLLDEVVARVKEIDFSRLNMLLDEKQNPNQWPVSYIPCPICKKQMHRKAHGVRSGVIVDVCKQDGIWLDGGELRSLFRWVASGGEVHTEQRLEERRRLEERYRTFSNGISARPGDKEYRSHELDAGSNSTELLLATLASLFGKTLK